MKIRLSKEREEKIVVDKEGMRKEREMYSMKKDVERVAKEVNELIEVKKFLSTEIVIINRKIKEKRKAWRS